MNLKPDLWVDEKIPVKNEVKSKLRAQAKTRPSLNENEKQECSKMNLIYGYFFTVLSSYELNE